MKTEIIKITNVDGDEKYNKVIELLRNDQVVGIPTETVYGLAGNAYSELAAERIFEAKGRPGDNPLIVHICDFSQLNDLVENVTENAKKLAEAFWPGPLTIILPKSDKIPLKVTGGLNTVAIRYPAHRVAQNIIRLSGFPLAAPSANRSGKPSPTTANHVFEDLNGRIELVIDGGDCEEGVESTVITLAEEKPRLLRPGNITVGQLRNVLGEVIVDDAVKNPVKEGARVASPGMKYKHYSPEAEIILVKSSYESFCEYVNSFTEKGVYAMVFGDEGKGVRIPYICYGKGDDYKALSQDLFKSLRELDKLEVSKCFVRCPDDSNEDNLAVLNRLLRAAGFKVVEL